MDEDRPEGRFEIGQDPHVEASVWARPRGDAEEARRVGAEGLQPVSRAHGVALHTVADEASQPGDTAASWLQRRRLLLAALAIAVLALLVWWAFRRVDSDPSGSDDGPQRTVTTQLGSLQGSTVQQAETSVV